MIIIFIITIITIIMIIIIIIIMIIKRKSRVCLQFTLFWFSSVVIFLSPYCPQII